MNISKSIFTFIIAVALSGCGSQNFQQMGSSVLSSTGIVTSSQADSFFSAGGMFAKAANSLSDEEEYYLGRGVSAVLLSRYKPFPNRQLQDYVSKVGSTVVAFSTRPEIFNGYHFMILDTDEVNAISAPGGFIFITKGFLKIIPDEESLAAVLAHEVGHVALSHGVQAISDSNLTQALTIIGKEAVSASVDGVGSELVGVFGDSIKDVADTLLTKGYSRSQEYNADAYAAEVLKLAGYNNAGLVTMLSALNGHEHGDSDSTGWFSTHPDPDSRISKVKGSVNKGTESLDGQEIRAARYRAAKRVLG